MLDDGELTFSWVNPPGTVAVQAEMMQQYSWGQIRRYYETDLVAQFNTSISYTPDKAGSYTVDIWTSTSGSCSSLHEHTPAVALAEN